MFVPVTIEGRETYVNEDHIDIFGVAERQVGENEDGSAILEQTTLITFNSGIQVPIDQSPREFIAAAYGVAGE